MFVRKKHNKSGIISIQVLKKENSKSILVKTIGSSYDPKEIERLLRKGKEFILEYGGQEVLRFENEQELVNQFFNALQSLQLMGPELLIGKVFDEIGFNAIEDSLFRELVIVRLVYPGSKLRTTEYLLPIQA